MKAARTEHQIAENSRAIAVCVSRRIRHNHPVDAEAGKPLKHHAEQSEQGGGKNRKTKYLPVFMVACRNERIFSTRSIAFDDSLCYNRFTF